MSIEIKTFASDVIRLQHFYTGLWHVEQSAKLPSDPVGGLVAQQHQQNFDLWHEEDKARDPSAKDTTIAQVKRNIDRLNQRRNDLITEIDVWLAENMLAAHQNEDMPWNSETIGSIVDRLSIASLKVYHMAEQTERDDASEEHINECQAKLQRLEQQRDDLAHALQAFIDDIVAGHKQNKLYRQFKMYNDPTLNPKIYNKS